jgi:hypothetical protein
MHATAADGRHAPWGVHLRTHLATRASLTEIQLAKYQTLRGYDAGGTNPVHKY